MSERGEEFEFVVLDVEPLRIRRRYPMTGRISVMALGGSIDKMRWSPDGAAILFAWGEVSVLLDLVDGAVSVVSRGHLVTEWAADGSGILGFALANFRESALAGFFFVRRGDTTRQVIADSAQLAAAGIHAAPPPFPGVMELSPTHRKLAVGLRKHDSVSLFIYDVSGGAPLEITRPARLIPIGERNPFRLAWSPDDSQIAILSPGRGGFAVDVVNVATGEISSVTRIPMTGIAMMYSFMVKFMSWSH